MSSEAITKNDLKNIINSMLPIFYPVGSYYETSDPTFDPNTEWGGEWELEASGNVHVSSGTGYTLGATGGSPYIQEHSHSFTNPSTTGTGSASITGGSHHHGCSISGNQYVTATTGDAGGLSRVSVKAGTGTAVTNLIKSGGNALTRATNTADNTSHTHSMVNHTHTISGGSVGNINTSGLNKGNAGNMPPYIVVNRWHRTA